MSSDEYDSYAIRKFENSCPEIGAIPDIVYLPKPCEEVPICPLCEMPVECPKCAEKDAEIARLAESIRHTSADCFRIQKERDELKAEIAKVRGDSTAWNKAFHEANEERKELKANLDGAGGAGVVCCASFS